MIEQLAVPRILTTRLVLPDDDVRSRLLAGGWAPMPRRAGWWTDGVRVWFWTEALEAVRAERRGRA